MYSREGCIAAPTTVKRNGGMTEPILWIDLLRSQLSKAFLATIHSRTTMASQAQLPQFDAASKVRMAKILVTLKLMM